MLPKAPLIAFHDLEGRRWTLILNYGLAKRIHESLGVDFVNAHNGQCFQQLAQDDGLFVAVLFAICEKQATAASVTPESFAEGLAGEQLEAAGEALAEAVKLFTRPGIRPVLDQMFAKGREGQQAAVALAVEKLQGPRAKAAIDRQLARLGQQLDEALDQSTATSSPTNGPPSPA